MKAALVLAYELHVFESPEQKRRRGGSSGLGRSRSSGARCCSDRRGRRREAWLLRHHVSCIEFYQHRGIRLQVLDGNGKSEVVEDKKLDFEVVELCQR